MTEPWFARRFPIGHPRNAMAPVHRRGWIVSWSFMGLLLLGAVGFGLFALANLVIAGAILFIGVAVVAGVAFIAIAQAKGDATRTVAEYKKDKTGV